MSSNESSPVPLEAVLCTEELNRRPTRAPDYQAENRALAVLVQALADSPRTILQKLADTILELFQADSAGLSLLTADEKRFYWPAIAGLWQPHLGGGTPRDFGPCGDVLDRDIPLLFRHFELRYTYFLPVTPPVEECLLVPFYVEGRAVGTIWAIAHTNRRKFDAEDKRQLVSLGNFASSAYQTVAFLEALEQQRETLRLSQTRYQALVEASSQIIWTTDASGAVVEDSPSWRAFTGQTYEQWKGFGGLDAFHPDDRERVRELWQRAVAERTPVETENRIRHTSGEWRWTAVRAQPVFNPDGSVREWVGMNTDITERKRADEERAQLLASERAARADAEAANRAKDEFLATVSHELRTPLTAVLGYSRLLGSGKILDEGARATALEAIQRNAKLQAALIEDLIDISRIMSGKLGLEFRPVKLAALLRTAIEEVHPLAQGKAIELRLDAGDGTEVVRGDAVRLQQVVGNLLTNAIKFTPNGGRIDVRLEGAGPFARISIRDTGIGIEPEFLPYIFERFRQFERGSRRTHEGLGLGLAIVWHLVKLHGGTVHAESTGLGKGATFTIELPIPAVIEGAQTGHLGVSEAADLSTAPKLEGVRALVVDDRLDARDMLALVLRQCGAEVIVAESAAAALVEMQRAKPDVLVSDIAMPGEDGYDLIRKVRALQPAQGGLVPALALTAYASVEDRTRALEAGYQMHLAKPVEPAKLTSAVASLVR